MRLLALSVALAVPALAQAQVVLTCEAAGFIASPANIFEPWEEHSRPYANGAIRIAHLDTGGEPVCCASHLLVLSPAGGVDEPEYRACHVVSGGGGLGFNWVDIPGTTASYDPVRGLLLSVPVWHWHDGMNQGRPAIVERMEVRINQAAGTVAVE
jgi:hypothetical protein